METKCSRCSKEITRDPERIGTGYATDTEGKLICYPCCAELDIEFMKEHGRITLYLTMPEAISHDLPRGTAKLERRYASPITITNWPGTLVFKVHYVDVRRHNFGGQRFDVHFAGPDGFEWHGVSIGDYTQLCHCRRTKKRRNV